jgi:hypothetical protein
VDCILRQSGVFHPSIGFPAVTRRTELAERLNSERRAYLLTSF